jgi:hypothetical protein
VGNDAYIESGKQNCGNGWLKLWLTVNSKSTGAEFLIADTDGSFTFNGNGSQGFLLCHPQINEGYLKKYTETP